MLFPNINPASKKSIKIVVATETIYWIVFRLVAVYHPNDWGDIEIELARSFLRIIASLILWRYFKTQIIVLENQKNRRVLLDLSLAIVLFLTVGILCGDSNLHGNFRLIYCATSIFVGVHEEFLWRGIILNGLLKKTTKLGAILFCNLYFLTWHLGVLQATTVSFIHIFLAGSVISIIYLRSGSIVLAIALHSIYDAINALSPFYQSPLSWGVGNFILIFTAVSAYRARGR
jgi:membrane protease YdiL (CAAX protease family)